MASAPSTTHADRVSRSLRRLGFRMTRTGQTFKVIDSAGALAAGTKPAMTLGEIETWIASPGRPRRT